MRVRATLEQLSKDYGPDLRIVWRDYVVHPQIAMTPALAGCAARLQGKGWEMNKAVFENAWDYDPATTQAKMKGPDKLAQPELERLAGTLGLNLDKFKADMAGEKCKAEIGESMKILGAVGVSGTPAFFVNGRFLSGAQPIDKFKAVIEEELTKANQAIASGTPASDYYNKFVVAQGKKSHP
jgi:protein-disulfide isomerase